MKRGLHSEILEYEPRFFIVLYKSLYAGMSLRKI